ncbi:MAG: 2Fe-2S iron-sulfur cluster-binding protein [Bdellovibrionia bacterium]
MPKVTFMPMNETYEANKGESVLDVGINNNVPIQHACGGFCACTTCHVLVKSGGENLSDMEEEETDRLERASGIELNSRLGCQARVMGDLVVEIVNLDDRF